MFSWLTRKLAPDSTQVLAVPVSADRWEQACRELTPYIDHHAHCGRVMDPPMDCDCGLDAVLKRYGLDV